MESTINIAPEDMGTTGLVDYVVKAKRISRDWQRLQKAVGIIRRRRGQKAVIPFCRAIWLAMDTNKWARNRMARQLKAFGFDAAA